MQLLSQLFKSNKAWAERVGEEDPRFFDSLARGQSPEYLWIGCSDSRVPATELLGLKPGDLFVHRNIANVVPHTDLNCLSVIEYAVGALGVRHILVCGHYGCGGVKAAMGDQPIGLIDNWLRHVRDVREKHANELDAIRDPDKRFDRLCELNVREQVEQVCETSIVQAAWRSGQPLAVHGLIFNLADGLLRDLGPSISRPEDLSEAYRLGMI